ncbi:glycoside hydrolase family 95 protein [Mucilaginibacter robiniae]|uniref:Glycoside hydrolase family 95 protein n=1 Tax=Mucilaginibacter robiniae TaxID=2728022 RepID=A0A7L5EA65_9SPHI|nr:glycoside hydrolase N-terminal domain-containing protein [Mucilaginibacter robiniae]QJD97276.1 glycoside hydrolase family 95 protein [Mucilaginibacter robiniae]
MINISLLDVKRLRRCKLVKGSFLIICLLGCHHDLSAQTQALKLWYNKPSQKWTDALPIGNGRLGGMIFGGVDTERVQFNEQTLWTGRPRAYQREGAVQYLPTIRKLLFEGKQKEAEALAEQHFMGKKDNEDDYTTLKAAWYKSVRNNTAPAATNYNDQGWKHINLPTEKGWETTPGFEGLDGAVWFRSTVNIPAEWAGKKLVLSLGRIRDIDYTYVNGTLVGNTDTTNYRRYKTPASVWHTGTNQIAVQVINFYDKGGLTSAYKELMVYPEDSTPEAGIPLSRTWKYWIQDDNVPAFPRYNADYQPFADVYLQFPKHGDVTGYKRDLDISNATAHVTYTSNGTTYTREYFSSAPDQVIAMHLTASQPGKITLNAVLKSLHKAVTIRKIDDHTLELSLKVRNGVLKGVTYLKAESSGGTLNVTNDGIAIVGANEATFYLAAATSFKNYHDVSGDPDAACKQTIQKLKDKSYAAIKAAHIRDYQNYFNLFSINLGEGKNAGMPTDERILHFNNVDDPSLISLYVQYGRYLLISSSRPGFMPANLQGIWNDLLTPPWGSKFTTNINLEMNYWPAEVLNLSACSQPLFNFIDDLTQTGQLTAKAHYGAHGWVLHHNTDLWRGTAPVNASNHGIWVTGAAWLCHQLWEHYEFTHDKEFLRTRAYPVMKSAAEFFVDFLIKDPKTGYLISVPSNSPEHGGLVAGPTMDHQIIRDLLKNCIAAEKILGTDAAFGKVLQGKYNQIAPNKIGKYGQLQEWMEDKDDPKDDHRHVSHMWGVYPGTDITWNTSALMKAAKQSMIFRGDEGTGWSIAWKTNIWARMHEGDHAYLMLTKLLSPADAVPNHEKGGIYHNMFDSHAPFQIDGNFGGAAGVSEMLLQSQMGYLDLLPALPSALPNGEVKGIRARGGFTLNLSWQKGALQQVEVRSDVGSPCTIKYQGKEISFPTQRGKVYRFNGSLKQL